MPLLGTGVGIGMRWFTRTVHCLHLVLVRQTREEASEPLTIRCGGYSKGEDRGPGWSCSSHTLIAFGAVILVLCSKLIFAPSQPQLMLLLEVVAVGLSFSLTHFKGS